MYLAGIVVGSCVGFFAAKISDAKRNEAMAQATQARIQELQALRGEMHATQQELWQR
jgi:hypothetical protein